MTELMNIYMLEDLSVNYFVKDLFAPFPMITIVDEFPKQVLSIPTISVVNGKLREEEYELGNSDTYRLRMWFIDIFAINKTQRDDFGYKILNELRTKGINVYDYNEGFPPDASPTLINHLSVIKRSYEPIDVIQSLNEKLYYRGQLILITKNDKV
jgi:hypothetical protein